jgi:hypothetical protein
MFTMLCMLQFLYEGESNENLKNLMNIRFPAPLFCKLAVQLPVL